MSRRELELSGSRPRGQRRPESGHTGLGDLVHIGIIVTDLSAAAYDFQRRWGSQLVDVADLELDDAICYGRPGRITIRHGFIRQGATDIELIQPLSERSPYAEWLGVHGDGVHHLAYGVVDIDWHLSRLRPLRGELVLDAHFPENGGRVVQIDGFAHGPVVELIEPPDFSGASGGCAREAGLCGLG